MDEETKLYWPQDAAPLPNDKVLNSTRIMAADSQDEDKMVSVTVDQVADKAAERVQVDGGSIPAIQGGTTAATAVELPNLGAGPNKYFDASWGYWKYNNVVLKNPTGTDGIPEGNDGTLYWNGTAITPTWSISKMQALPIPQGVNVINPIGNELPTEKAVADYTKPLFDLTSPSTNVIDNTKVEAGAYRLSDGGKITTDNAIRYPIIPIPAGKTHMSIAGIGTNQAGAQAVFAFYSNANGTGYISGSNTKVGTVIPVGANFVGITFASETDIGEDPVNNPYKNTMQVNWSSEVLPYEPFQILLDSSKITGVQPAVSSSLSNLDTRVSFLESQNEYEYKFPVGSSIDGLNHLINANGDFIEFTARIETLTGNNQLRMFGTPPTNINAFGFYLDIIRLRGNVANEAWTEFTGLASFGQYHTYKLIVNGANWDLYVDGVFSQSKPKASGLLVTTIGNAYTQTLPFWLKDAVTIKAGGSTTTYRNFSEYNPTIEQIDITPEKSDQPDVLVQYSPSGGSGNGEFIVYTRRSGKRTYTGIQIRREIDPSRYWDYWRIYKADEYTYDNGAMMLLVANIITIGESEFTWQQKGKDSHTGGAHQYEEFQLMKAYINGQEINLSTVMPLTICESFYYTEKSEMIERPWINNTPIVVGRNVQANHYKRTDITQGQYKVTNTMKWAQSLSDVLYIYIGIVCIGRISATTAHDDYFNQTVLGDVAGKKLDGTGRNTINMINNSTGYNCQISSAMIIKNTGLRERLWIQDRTIDSKYYLINNSSNSPTEEAITVEVGEVWEAECTVEFN